MFDNIFTANMLGMQGKRGLYPPCGHMVNLSVNTSFWTSALILLIQVTCFGILKTQC